MTTAFSTRDIAATRFRDGLAAAIHDYVLECGAHPRCAVAIGDAIASNLEEHIMARCDAAMLDVRHHNPELAKNWDSGGL